MLQLLTLVVGPLAENVYIISSDNSKECVVIDPGAEGQKIVEAINGSNLIVRYIVVTHGHPDHTGAVSVVKKCIGGDFCAHEGDLSQIERPLSLVTAMLPDFIVPPPLDRVLKDGDKIVIDGLTIDVLSTPGHTPGSVSLLAEDCVFTGDTLFKRSIGRYDLPGGDKVLEVQSIKNQLMVLPSETRVMPGHGSPSTIGEEMEFNLFLQ